MVDLVLDVLNYDEIALKGAELISDFFYEAGDNVLLWSPSSPDWNLPNGTALVYHDLYLPEGQVEKFKTLLRHFFEKADIQELSYVEDFNGGTPIWVMLVTTSMPVNLTHGVYVCRAATWSRSIKKTIHESVYPKRRLDPIFKLLIPHYPNCDFSLPLDQLILPSFAESDRELRAASERSNDVGGRCDD